MNKNLSVALTIANLAGLWTAVASMRPDWPSIALAGAVGFAVGLTASVIMKR
jgi:hypothetical protein